MLLVIFGFFATNLKSAVPTLINIVNEIGKENPQLRADLLKNVFSPNTNIISNIVPYLVVALIIYLIFRK